MGHHEITYGPLLLAVIQCRYGILVLVFMAIQTLDHKHLWVIITFVNQATVVPIQSQLKAINSGTASNVANVEPVVALHLLFHGLSGSFLVLQAMILKYAYVEMKALIMRMFQWSWWRFMFNNYYYNYSCS